MDRSEQKPPASRSARILWRLAAAFALVFVLSTSAVAVAAAFGFLESWGSVGTGSGALRGPDNLAVDTRGDVYVADRDNNRVQEFSFTGQFIARLGRNGGDGSAGVGNGEFKTPRGVATDGFGDLWVADSGNNRIEKFDSSGRFVARFGRNGGDGSAGLGNAEFNDPRGIATDAAGNLFVADHGNNRIQELTSDGGFIARFGRNGGDGSAGRGPGEFNQPRGVAVDASDNIFVADKTNNRVQKLSSAGQPLAVYGRNGGDGSAGSAAREFRIPYSVTLDADGNLFVADRGNNRVQELTSSGAFIAAFGRAGGSGGAGNGPGEFRGPYGVAADCRGGLFVTDEGNDRVERFGDPAAPAPICPAVLSLSRPSARILHDRGVNLQAQCDRPCTIVLSGSVKRGGSTVARLRMASRSLIPGQPLNVKLRLASHPLKRVAGELARHHRLSAQIRARVTSFAGASAVQVARKPLSRR